MRRASKPSIILYRRILRLHRRLPPAMRSLGDDYVKAEFHRHQRVVEPIYIHQFMKEWTQYAQHLESQLSVQSADTVLIGNSLDPQRLDHFSKEQLGQLFVLKQEVKEALRPSSKNNDEHFIK